MGILKIDQDTVTKNTPKGESLEGVTVPASYEIEQLSLYNEDGEEEENFRSIVNSIKIIEELYSPVIICKINVLDDQDFFQKFKITGKEILVLKIKKRIQGAGTGGTEERIELGFIVKEYPSYRKSTSGIQHQEYDIIFTTPFAYFSRVQTISLSVEGNIFDITKDLYKDYLGVDSENILFEGEECPYKIKTVITKRTPLQAVTWLLSKARTVDGYPYMMWQTINAKYKNKIIIKSWDKIIKKDFDNYVSKKPYTYKKFFIEEPGTIEHTKETLSSIISFSSSLKIDKLDQVIKGGFGNKLTVFDYEAKLDFPNTFTPPDPSDKRYSLENLKDLSDKLGLTKNRFKPNTANNNSFTSSIFSSINESLQAVANKIFDTQSLAENSSLFLHKPAPLYENIAAGAYKTTIDINEQNKQKTEFLKASSENISHNCVLYGDFNLNPGLRIILDIPQTTDGPLRDTNELPNQAIEDSDLSGEYIITLAVHNFQNGEYTTKLRLIKPLEEGVFN